MELAIAGRTALVTGAAGGIGRAVAGRLAAEQVNLVLADVQAPDDVAAELSGSGAVVSGAVVSGAVVSTAMDVTDPGSVRAGVALAEQTFGGLDLVVGCAGISGPVGTGIEELAGADWDRVLAVNLTGTFHLLQAAVPSLRRSPAAAVVVVASDSAFVAAPGMAPYCASKAGVLQLIRAASVEFADAGIRFAAVSPSIVDTPMSRGDLGRDGFADVGYPVQTADEVAAQIAFLCSPLARAVSGTQVVSDFGYSARSGFPA